MRDNALYFPYINVPQSSWFTRVLLYWDSVSSIVPYEYIEHPERLDPYTRDLVTAGLVTQVIPGMYINHIPNFEDAFLTYVRQQMQKPAGHRGFASYRSGMSVSLHAEKLRRSEKEPLLIHMEKVGGVGGELEKLGLAKQERYPWYQVETWVAEAFMMYLAATLGQLEDVNAAPVTDDRVNLKAFGCVPDGARRMFERDRRRTPIRSVILERLLPSPEGEVNINDLVNFKSAYKDSLNRFRLKVEDACVELANINQPDDRQERLEAILRGYENEIDAITDAMRSRWKRVVFNTLVPVLGAGVAAAAGPLTALGAASLGLGLVPTIYQAFDGARQYETILSQPLAYAALARERIL